MRKWSEIEKRLAEKLDVDRVKTRKVGGTTIPYLEGEDVIRTANEIFGFDGWSGEPSGPVQSFQITEKATLYSVPYRLEFHGLTDDGEVHTITHGDIGKNTSASNHTNNHEMAISGCATDALKRSMRHLGDQFGLALYDKESETFIEATGSNSSRSGRSKKKKTTKKATKSTLRDRALAYVIPDMLPMGEDNVKPPLAGEKLSDVVEDSLGREVIGWLAGLMDTPIGLPPLDPKNEEQEKLQKAAKFLWDENFAKEEEEGDGEDEE
jgi:hypothetical protein